MSINNRIFSRIQFASPATLTVDSTVIPIGEIINLSVGGALVPCDQQFDEGTRCLLQIPLLGTTDMLSVQVKGELVWNSAKVTAIKFTSIDPDSLFHLQNIIRYNAEHPDKIESEIQEHKGLK